jgi:uncharacterized protein YdeI (YjbR/CyaY-like superfamily)
VATATIRFDAVVQAAHGQTFLKMPKPASQKLPSRGQVAARATINGQAFQTVVEPDGSFGHWIRVDAKLQKEAGVGAGDKATVEVEPTKEWPEPAVPPDLKKALAAASPKIRELWDAITPMARWEWVRWVNETKNKDTRKKRVGVTISKLSGGKRRPCCFNLSSCTDPNLAKSGKLVEPE